ncbi:hypothetical protein [Paenarthrobacter sp. NPDC058040]|uniref:hypothetical protein n=1 Tax=unclassified Paenarthrobacter TaxID=2634190 RepID=UPI0036DF2FBD
MTAAWVSLPFSTGVSQLDDFVGLGVEDGVAEAAAVAVAVVVGSGADDGGCVTSGATVTGACTTAGCGAWTTGAGAAGAGGCWVSRTLVGTGFGVVLPASGASPGSVGVGSVGAATGGHVPAVDGTQGAAWATPCGANQAPAASSTPARTAGTRRRSLEGITV